MSKCMRALVVIGVALAVPVAMRGQTVVNRSPSPTAMLFYGPPLAKTVIVSGGDTAAFGDLFRQSSVTAASLGDRPNVGVALFWGTSSDPARNGTPLANLTPEMGWQHGRYYFPKDDQPAVLLVAGFTKVAAATPRPTNPAAFSTGGPLDASATPILTRLGLIRP